MVVDSRWCSTKSTKTYHSRMRLAEGGQQTYFTCYTLLDRTGVSQTNSLIALQYTGENFAEMSDNIVLHLSTDEILSVN